MLSRYKGFKFLFCLWDIMFPCTKAAAAVKFEETLFVSFSLFDKKISSFQGTSVSRSEKFKDGFELKESLCGKTRACNPKLK